MRAGRVAGRRAGVAAAMMVAVLAFGGGVVSAHDPIIVTDRQTSPDTGPVLPDGTISFALYGVVHGPDDTRGFRVSFAQGDRLALSLLVPALDPEQALGPDELPTLQVARPDGTRLDVQPTERVRFDESFSGTSYLRLAEVDEAAQAGEYRVTVVGHAPSRFTVSVGSDERFGTPVQQVDDRNAGVAGVQSWYATAPAAAAVATTVVDAPVTAVDATAAATSAADETDTTPAGDTVPPVSAGDSSGAAATSSVPGGVPTTTDDDSSGAAGSAVFFGVMTVILATGVVLYLRRRSR